MGNLNYIDILGLICSILGAILFIYALSFEKKIIFMLKKIKNPKDWKFERLLTIFFFFGYVINILSILMEWQTLREVFGSLVFVLGAIFLVFVVYISFKTYKVIFDAAENEIGEDLQMDKG